MNRWITRSGALLSCCLWLLLCATVPARGEPPASGIKDNRVLAHVDVETTGLTPGYHEMIDIGMIITDPDGVEIDRLFLRIMPDHPERLDPGAARVNGFSVARWEQLGHVSTADAVRQIDEFVTLTAAGRQVLFIAFNAWFDIAFVDHLFRSQDRSWRDLFHYFVLDLPSMAWSLGIRNLQGAEIAARTGLEPETIDPLEHTGTTGVEFNVALYRRLIKMGGVLLDGKAAAP